MNKLSSYIYRQQDQEKAGVDFTTVQNDVRTLFKQVTVLKNQDAILEHKENLTDDIAGAIAVTREILDSLVALYFASKSVEINEFS